MTRKKAKRPEDDQRPQETAGDGETLQAESDQTPRTQDAQQPADPLEAAQAQSDDLLARLQRVSADYLNYQKRAQRDLGQARQYANEDLIKALLPVIDDMERVLAAARENHGKDDPLFTGMQLVHDKAIDTLGRFGVKVIEAEGKPFDPDRHTAMMQQPADDCEPNTVLQEMQRGYQLRGRTIRPAAVVVAKAPGPDDADEAPAADDE